MAKRFTSTEKWDKEWFQNLSPRLKCLWQYMTDRCDHSGVWEANYRMASFCIGEEVNEGDLEAFGDRVERIDDEKVFLKQFVDFQYGLLTPSSKPHYSVIKLLEKHGLPVPLKPADTLTKPLPKGSATVKDKDKGKSKVKVNTALPDDWKPNENHERHCSENRLDIDNAALLFEDWARGGGAKRLDWNRVFSGALRTWLPEKLAKMPTNKKTGFGPNGLRKEVIKP